MPLESSVVILTKIYFIQIFGCNIVKFSLHRCKWGIFVWRSSDIWVTGCNYVESVTFVRKCSNISLWGR
jgi:hypothetical protein